MTVKLIGNWVSGVAIDYHTLKSEYLGEDENGRKKFNTTRSEIGELLYQLKYQQKKSAVSKIVEPRWVPN